MNISITHLSLVVDFLDKDFNSKTISDLMRNELESLLIDNAIHLPDGWTLIFRATYSNSYSPLVSKNKTGSYPSDKLKYITIVIPIPLTSEIKWGVDESQHIYGKDHYDRLKKNFWELPIDCKQFHNRQDYILYCLRKGIKKTFEEGFTVGGVKVKIKKGVHSEKVD